MYICVILKSTPNDESAHFTVAVSFHHVLPRCASAKKLYTAIPCIFTFGDSLLNAGNNNHLKSAPAKANTLPNGIDFPTHNATGRFCNGKIVPDFIGERLTFCVPSQQVIILNDRIRSVNSVGP